jgi:hypothetical protein
MVFEEAEIETQRPAVGESRADRKVMASLPREPNPPVSAKPDGSVDLIQPIEQDVIFSKLFRLSIDFSSRELG